MTKQVTHSDQSVWDELVEKEDKKNPNSEFIDGVLYAEKHVTDIPRVKALIEALAKIADPRLRDHREPDAQTEVYCMIHIASEALSKFEGSENDNT